MVKKAVNKRKRIVIAAITIGVVGVAVYGAVRVNQIRQEQIQNAENQVTAAVQRRTLVSSVAATGKIAGVSLKEVTGQISPAKILSLPVKVGDVVEEGTLLCEFDPSDIQESLEEAKKSLATAQEKNRLDVAAAERNLEQARTSSEIELARQEQDLQAAWDAFIQSVQDMENAKKAWDEACENTGATNGELHYWKEQWEAKGSVSGNSLEADKVTYWQGKFWMAQQAESNAETAYHQAQAAMEAQEELYEKQLRLKEDSLRNQDSTLASRQDTLSSSQLNADSLTRTDKQRIEDLEKQLEDSVLYSPAKGVITQIRFQEGDTYTGGAFITIEDVSGFEVWSEIDEYDIGKIEEGQDVVIKTNGTGEEELSGKVLSIAPKATVTAGAGAAPVTYQVKISIDTPNDLLKLDMTAKLSIITSNRENVLTVPYEAIQEDENGNFYVEVLRGDTVSKVSVEKGIESDYYVEITSSDLKEKEEVIIPASEDDTLDIMDLLEGTGPMGGF